MAAGSRLRQTLIGESPSSSPFRSPTMQIPKSPDEAAVYIVDDDEAVRDSLTMLLEAAGFAVEPFASALEALSRCHERRPACVLTDVRMPRMDGPPFQGKLAGREIVRP